jgi:hypothetical protein
MLFFRRRRDVAHHQKLLAMYRAVLAEFLRQRKQWDSAEIPSYLVTGVIVLRGHILDEKGTLRSWNAKVADHPDDDGPGDQRDAEILHQRELLAIHRANLQLQRRQYEHYGEHQAPAHVVRSRTLTRRSSGSRPFCAGGMCRWKISRARMMPECNRP